MALIKNITNQQGVTMNYHRLNDWTIKYNLDHSQIVTALLASYLDQATRAAGNLPVKQSTFRLNADASTSITQAFIYDQIKKQAGWTDAISDATAASAT